MNENFIRLSKYLSLVKEAVDTRFKKEIWLTAEISQLSHKKHLYLELIDTNPDTGIVLSKVRAIIWESNIGVLKKFKRDTNGLDLIVGLKVLIKAHAVFSELYGISLIITDLNPEFTIGTNKLKKDEAIKKLKDNNLYDKNKKVKLNNLIENIVVIGSENAAGLNDFKIKIKSLTDCNILKVMYIDSVFQGQHSEEQLLIALTKTKEICGSYKVDLVVLIRGGGAKSDLLWLDNYNIAEMVCEMPVPVITGLGHDDDISLIDEVSAFNVGTPSKCAHFIFDRNLLAAKKIEENWLTIKNKTSRIIINHEKLMDYALNLTKKESKKTIEMKEQEIKSKYKILKIGITNVCYKIESIFIENMNRIKSSSSFICQIKNNELDTAFNLFKSFTMLGIDKKYISAGETFKFIGKNSIALINRCSEKVVFEYKNIVMAGPQKVLSLGYCFATDSNQKAITTAEEAKESKKFNVHFSDNQILVSVYKPRK
jgi:exodeoxyribonuclease VII large subunit